MSKNAMVFIYSLNCPDTGMPGYVGKAIDPEKRFREHLLCKKDFRKSRWIRSLQREGKLPVLEVLLEVPEASWEGYEMDVIEVLRSCGYNITNTTDGGDCVTMTPEIRLKIGAARKGRKHTLESREKMSNAMAGRKCAPFSPEHRANMSAARKGRKFTLETRLKISAAKMGKKQTPEHRENNSASKKGKKHTLETRQKMSATHRLRLQKTL